MASAPLLTSLVPADVVMSMLLATAVDKAKITSLGAPAFASRAFGFCTPAAGDRMVAGDPGRTVAGLALGTPAVAASML